MRKYMTKVGVGKIIDSSMHHDSLYYDYDSVSMQKKPPETNVIKKKLSSFFYYICSAAAERYRTLLSACRVTAQRTDFI